MNDMDARAKEIAKNWEGIYPTYEAFYIHSIKYSLERALESFWRYGDGLEKGDSELAVSSIHEAFTHAAGLSRFFWPSSMGRKNKKGLSELKEKRALKLRKAFNLNDSSPLKNRKLRDALEHFDERLDQYLLSNLVGNVFPGAIVDRLEQSSQPITHAFKLVDPEQAAFSLLGEVHFFEPLCVELARISEIVDSMCENGYRLKRDGIE